MDEVFGEVNFVSEIAFAKTTGLTTNFLSSRFDFLLWYGKSKESLKFRRPYMVKSHEEGTADTYSWIRDDRGDFRALSRDEKELMEVPKGYHLYKPDNITSQGNPLVDFEFEGGKYSFRSKTPPVGLSRLARAGRIHKARNSVQYVRNLDDFGVIQISQLWGDTGTGGFTDDKLYVVQTGVKTIQRCILMATDPGDLVLDPTCGSGTTATVAEQWGRRWITIDTSRVALALARARIMGARYPFYLLADSPEGAERVASEQWLVASKKSAGGSAPASAASHQPLSTKHFFNDIRHGFVYERVPHITLKSIANNAEIDVIWEQFEQKLAPLRGELSVICGLNQTLEEWEVPREAPSHWPPATQPLLTAFWRERIERQKAIDASIAAKAEFESLYDKPYEDKKTVRVAGPFTVESLSPFRVLGVDEDDELIDPVKVAEAGGDYATGPRFERMILENLRTAGVQQAHKEDRIVFTSLVPWPGRFICAEGRFLASGEWMVDRGQGEAARGRGTANRENQAAPTTNHQPLSTDSLRELRAGIFIGPEFGTVARPDLVEAAREAGDAGFDVVIACAFNYDAHAGEFKSLGRIPALKARMNADLHMAEDLKATGKGNLFVIFGEPDIEVASGQWLVASNGRMVAHYDGVKELSRLGSVEEINRLGGTDLPRLKRLSAGGEIRADESNAPGGGIGGGKHRRGRGQNGDGGIPSVPERGERVAGRSGDVSDSGGTAGLPDGDGSVGAGSGGGRNQPDARRTQALAAIQTFTANDFPLSLTTAHHAQVTVKGVDVFDPSTGEVRSDSADGIACWFIDTNYNGESFFVRHAYFLGQNDPYRSLRTTLKAEINEEAWATLNSDTSRPFEKPETGRIAVKVINHLGDEVMKVFRVG
jgi:adenine-specific DNA-methyltransferase